MTTERKINNLADLQKERLVVRGEIHLKEEILKQHYAVFSEKLKPAMKVVNFISGNRLFKGIKNEEGAESFDWMGILMKVALAGGIGGLLLKNSKKNLMRTAFAFALDQGTKFMKEKDLSVYIDKIKEWFSKKEKEEEEVEQSL